MNSFPPSPNGAPKASQEKPPRSPKPAAPTVEIGLLLQLHAKGFGFAQPLTGTTRTTVFLNESRIAALRLQRPEPEGTLIRMSVVDKADGKRAATEARLLELDDPLAAERLWSRIQHTAPPPGIPHLQARRPERPALLPLILVLHQDKLGSIALLQSLATQLPADTWPEPMLRPLLHLAPAAVRRGIIQQQLQQAPEAALALLRGTPGAPALEPEAAWLEQLWERLPEQRPAILGLAQRPRRFGNAAEQLTWARRGIEQDSPNAEYWWPQLSQALAGDPAGWSEAWDHWPALDHAPATVIRELAGQRQPAFAAATQALENLAEWTARHAQFDANEILGALDEQDKALASQWISTPAPNPDVHRALLAQMQTARAAEKCVLRYFRSLGLDVRDVSIDQLSGQDSGWQQMDLQINGLHGVDVKNCRRTVNGGMRSGRWKVKAFKADATGRAVTLCGVSSPHTRFEEDTLTAQPRRKGPAFLADIGEPVPMFVLGVVRASEVQNLNRRFREIAEIRMPTQQRLAEMPVWAWDYPDAHYRPRNEALSVLRQALSATDPSTLQLRLRRDLPPLLWSLLDQDPPQGSRPLDEQQREFLQELRQQWRSSRGSEPGAAPVPRLPWLYLFILHSWLRRRLAGKASAAQGLETLFQPAASAQPPARSFRRLGADPDRPASSPGLAAGAGIADPAKTLEPLLKTLATLDQHLPPEKFVGITQFTLLGNGIFSGVFPDGRRRTLLAHCGGKLEGLMVDCGKWPLVFGKEESCSCGRLICPECGCCSDPAARDPCPHQQERQAQAREAQAASETRRPAQRPGTTRRAAFFPPGGGGAS